MSWRFSRATFAPPPIPQGRGGGRHSPPRCWARSSFYRPAAKCRSTATRGGRAEPAGGCRRWGVAGAPSPRRDDIRGWRRRGRPPVAGGIAGARAFLTHRLPPAVSRLRGDGACRRRAAGGGGRGGGGRGISRPRARLHLLRQLGSTSRRRSGMPGQGTLLVLGPSWHGPKAQSPCGWAARGRPRWRRRGRPFWPQRAAVMRRQPPWRTPSRGSLRPDRS